MLTPATRDRLDSEGGFAGTVLVMVIAWALVAVAMLTQTLVAARQIDQRVVVIRTEVGGIDGNLDAVDLARETHLVAADILVAAEPLRGQLDQVISSAAGIDASGKAILSTAGDINGNVKSINGSVLAINSSAKGILGNLGGVLTQVNSINDGVEAINRRADTIIGLARAIKSDTGNIIAQVNEVHKHANSIDCSPAVVLQSSDCGAHGSD